MKQATKQDIQLGKPLYLKVRADMYELINFVGDGILTYTFRTKNRTIRTDRLDKIFVRR